MLLFPFCKLRCLHLEELVSAPVDLRKDSHPHLTDPIASAPPLLLSPGEALHPRRGNARYLMRSTKVKKWLITTLNWAVESCREEIFFVDQEKLLKSLWRRHR